MVLLLVLVLANVGVAGENLTGRKLTRGDHFPLLKQCPCWLLWVNVRESCSYELVGMRRRKNETVARVLLTEDIFLGAA